MLFRTPRKIVPEYEHEKWNMVVLPTKAHYLVHYLLYKAIKHSSCVYSFNQMRRVSKQRGIVNCRLYASVRKDFALAIQSNNLGRTVSQECRVAASKRFANTNLYRNKDTHKIQRFIVGTQPDNWEPFQTGRVRTQISREKLGRSMKGRMWQYHPDTKDVKFTKDRLPGYVLGFPDWILADKVSNTQGTVWYTNETTGQSLRLEEGQTVPPGYIRGRSYNNVGIERMNAGDKIKVINLLDKQYSLIDKHSFDPQMHMMSGSSLSNTVVYEYESKKIGRAHV